MKSGPFNSALPFGEEGGGGEGVNACLDALGHLCVQIQKISYPCAINDLYKMYFSTNVFLSQMASSKSQQNGNEDSGEGQVGLGSTVTLVVRAE